MAAVPMVASLQELQDRHAASGLLYAEVLRVEALSAGVYRLEAGGEDRQTPHREDEVYVVLAGRGSIEIQGIRHGVSVGSVVYVPRGFPHRFVDIVEDLEVLVVFAPAESDGRGSTA